MKVVLLNSPAVSPEVISKWDDFVMSHPGGNIFQGYAFFSLCFQPSGYKPFTVMAFTEDDSVCGVMQGVIMREKGLLTGPFTSRAIAWGGPLANDDATALALLEEYERGVGRRVIYSQLRPVGDPPDKDLLIRAGYSVEPHLDIFNDLSVGGVKMLNAVHKERRRNIGRAISKGVTVRLTNDDTDIQLAVSLILRLYKRIGLPSPPARLLTEAERFLGDALKVFVAEYDGKMIGARMVLCYHDMIYDWYAGSDPDYHNKYVNDLLPWEVMVWGSLNDFRVFDFGGAGAPEERYGVRDFKLRFGGRMADTYRFTRVHKPFFMFTGKQGIKAYKVIKKLFR